MVYLEGRYSPQGDQGLKWEEDLGPWPDHPLSTRDLTCLGLGRNW